MKIIMNTFDLTFDEQYEFIKLYDILRDMDFELTPLQESVFEKVMTGNHNLYYQGMIVTGKLILLIKC